MATQDYVRWELPDGRAFEAKGSVRWVEIPSWNWTVTAPNEVTAAADRLGTSSSLKAGFFWGLGGGEFRVSVRFDSWKGETNEWGNAANDAGPIAKAQEFSSALIDQPIDTFSPIIMSFGERSPAGSKSPLTVVPAGDPEFPFDATDSTTTFTARLDFFESIDIGGVAHSLNPF